MKHSTFITLVVIAALALTGCAATPNAATVTVTETPSQYVTSPAKLHTKGETVTQQPGITVTYNGIGKPYKHQYQDQTHIAVNVTMCNNTGETIDYDETPWTLRTTDSENVETASTYDTDTEGPLYATTSGRLSNDDCAKGNLLFPVSDGQTFTRLTYAPDSGEPVQWNLK